MIKVLMVEDSKIMGQALKKIIEADGDMLVAWVQTYQEALTLLETESNNYFLALLDIILPDAPTGEIVDLILSRNIPSIIFTAEFSDQMRELIWSKRNVIDYVLKEGPIAIEYIASLVQRIKRNRAIEVLVVDDSKVARMQISTLLRVHQYQVFEAKDGHQALEILKEKPNIKMVISDFFMPGMDGFELTRNIRLEYRKDQLVVIGISGRGNNIMSARFIKTGANDFIAKPFLSEEFYCRISQNIENLEQIEEIRHLSCKDFLTNLYNRRYFFENGSAIFKTALTCKRKICIAMVDIDWFKTINDMYGHDAGDMVLQKISAALCEPFKNDDIVCRFGGEEFCILLMDTSRSACFNFFEEIRKKIEELSLLINDTKIKVTISTGICAKKKQSLEEMIKVADECLYEAKKGGRNCVMMDKW